MNLTLCNLRLEDFSAAIQSASRALDLDPRNTKVLYRRGLAFLASASLIEAKADFLQASRLAPQHGETRAKLDECKKRLARCEFDARQSFGNVFGKAIEQVVVVRDLSFVRRCWLDIRIGRGEKQRLWLSLYDDNVPLTAGSFRALCSGMFGIGQCGLNLCYRMTPIHKIVKGSVIEAGDVHRFDGTGGESIYGPKFPDESFANHHHKRGLLSMVNVGPDTNNSKFFITMRSLSNFNGKNVVFGEVVSGMDVLDEVENVETEANDKPKVPVTIVDCGVE